MGEEGSRLRSPPHKSYPTYSCCDQVPLILFLYRTTLICVITTLAAAAFEVQCYDKQPQRGTEKSLVCVCGLHSAQKVGQVIENKSLCQSPVLIVTSGGGGGRNRVKQPP